jgi:probable HAF family extracellular repeat protein
MLRYLSIGCFTALLSCATNAASFTGLGDLPGGGVFGAAYGVSANGRVTVGEAMSGSGTEAVRYTKNGDLIALGDLEGGQFRSYSRGVSDDGETIVGLASSASGFEAFRWTTVDSMVGLGDLAGGDFDSQGVSVSADGTTIVGHSVGASGREAFRWTATESMVGLGDLPGGLFRSYAEGVSADGTVVVGFSTGASGQEAFRWTASGGMTGLGDLPGGSFSSLAKDVSADGNVIVGYGSSALGSETMRWTAGGGMRPLGDLDGGQFQSFANAVSADGNVIVGQASTTNGFEAFLWTEADGMQNLRELLLDAGVSGLDDWSLTTALDISPDGRWVVGRGINPAGETEGYLANVVDGDGVPNLEALADVNGNNKTDLGVLLRDPDAGKNKLYVMDGGSGKRIKTVTFGSAPVRGSTSVSDADGNLIPEFGALLEGSLFATVKDVVNNTLLGKPTFNANFDPVAFLSVGDVGGGVGPDVAMVGRNRYTGTVQAVVKDVASGTKVKSMSFDKNFVPFDAVALDNIGDTNAMEIAVLGINASGKIQAQVKDARSGNLINKLSFNKDFTPLFFAAVPNANGKLKFLAVLGRNASGVIQAQIKRAGDGALIRTVKFSKNYDPMAFISFADSNGSGSSEVGVVGVNGSGAVRAQVKEISDGTLVKTIKFSKNYPPLDAIAINGVAGTGQNEIAVLGRNSSDQLRLQIKDLLTGNLVKNIPVP